MGKPAPPPALFNSSICNHSSSKASPWPQVCAHSNSVSLHLILHLLQSPPTPPWWLRWQRICLQCRRPGFNPWIRKIPWRRQWHPTPVLLPGKSHGWRSLVGCTPWGHKSRTRLSDFTFTFHFHALEKDMATTPVFLPGESQGRGSLVGRRLWGRTESDTTEVT